VDTLSVIRAIAAGIALIIMGASYIAAFAVIIIGTWWGIARIVDGDVVNGMLTILFTAPVMAITQAVIGFLAIPFGLLAERD
jgi:hypothetical protein